MKRTRLRLTIFWMLLLAFTLMLTGKAIACFAPSAMEMGQGKAMDCCMERCRMETTPEDAKKACEQSLQAFSLQEMLSSAKNDCGHFAVTVLSDINPLALFSDFLHEPDPQFKPQLRKIRPERYRSAPPLYSLIQSFLI